MAVASFLELIGSSSAQRLAMLTITLFLLPLLALLLRRRPPSFPHLPPSPPSQLPFLGHLLVLPRILGLTSSLRLQFGPIFSLRLGPSLAIFITSASLAHHALVVQGSRFASRPLIPSRALFTSNFRNINAAPYGPYWRTVRRNLVHEMLISNKLLSFKPARKRVLDAMIRRLHDQAQKSEGVVAVYSNCHTSMFQLLLLMCLGIYMNDDALQAVIELVHELLLWQFVRLSDYYPLLRPLEWYKNRKHRILRQRQVDLFTSLIEQHKELRKTGELTPGSYLETLLRMDEEGETKLSTSDLVSLCTEFVVTGTDPTVNCMEWTMAHIVKDTLIQSKLYNEIEQVVGSRPVEEEDLVSMRYLQAVVKETLRLHPPGHFTIPHAVTEPCKLAGYDIPAEATINFHLASISRDPEVWEEPLEYVPERFSRREVDITGSKEVTMIPFGAGRRICPGAGLALMHVELFVARLVQVYEWRTWKPGAVVDMSEKLRFTIVMKTPLQAAIRERRPSVVYNKEH